jgi:ankyrin repeat protein
MYWSRSLGCAILSLSASRRGDEMTSWDDYKKTMEAPVTLFGAAKDNDVATLRRLLAAGAELDARDSRGHSPLMLAAYNGQVAALDCLLAAGANPNSADDSGNSILMGACFKGYVEIIHKLLEAGADAGARNAAGLDAHGWAVMFGRSDVAALLQARAAR